MTCFFDRKCDTRDEWGRVLFLHFGAYKLEHLSIQDAGASSKFGKSHGNGECQEVRFAEKESGRAETGGTNRSGQQILTTQILE